MIGMYLVAPASVAAEGVWNSLAAFEDETPGPWRILLPVEVEDSSRAAGLYGSTPHHGERQEMCIYLSFGTHVCEHTSLLTHVCALQMSSSRILSIFVQTDLLLACSSPIRLSWPSGERLGSFLSVHRWNYKYSLPCLAFFLVVVCLFVF